jgi:hypothetical protein
LLKNIILNFLNKISYKNIEEEQEKLRIKKEEQEKLKLLELERIKKLKEEEERIKKGKLKN